MGKTSHKIKAMEAYSDMKAAKQTYYKELFLAFPVGQTFSYMHGSHVRSATILGHRSGTTEVTSPSGKSFWLYTIRLLEYALRDF